jgi:hypothetical protein
MGVERKMGKEIRIIKKDGIKISDGSTFIDDGLVDPAELRSNENDSNLSSSDKKYKEYIFKLRNNPKKDMKSPRRRSRLVGGHSTKSHSPVYE